VAVYLWKTSNDLVFNTALIRTTLDPEESLVSPGAGPAVGNDPVVDSTVHTPAQNLDAVSTKQLSTSMSVHSTGILQEILVHIKARLHWSVCHNLRFDSIVLCRHTVDAGELVLVGVVVDAVVAGLLALGSVDEVQAWLLSRRASGDGVGVASSRDESVLLGEFPGSAWVSTFASSIISIARNHVGERQLGVVVLVDAISVCDSLNSSESPARSAFSLVLDGANGSAAWPLGSGVEGSRYSGRSVNLYWERFAVGVFLVSH